MPATVLHGNCLELLPTIPDGSVDAVVTDPPYGLSDITAKQTVQALTAWLSGDRDFLPAAKGFMGHDWDGFVPPPAVFDELLRVLKPGGHMAVFGSPRTMDLLGMSVRLAGFELRDTLAWLYGSGMPKTTPLKRQFAKRGDDITATHFHGHATGLRPGFEPILLARKPFTGSALDNLVAHGTGALDIASARIPFTSDADRQETTTKNRHGDFGTQHGLNSVYGDYAMLGVRSNYSADGRWPSNVVLDEGSAAQLDAANPINTAAQAGVSRFFYCARASASERPSTPDGTAHVTVKPLALMQWLVDLVAPPGIAHILDQYAGSGTTGEAALRSGHDVTLIEREAAFLPLVHVRIERSSKVA